MKKGRLESIELRVIFGTEDRIRERIQEGGRGTQINTSYVENRNGGYRRENKRVARKTQCHSKERIFHEAQLDFSTAFHNFAKPNMGLRIKISDSKKRFKKKYLNRTPAMAENLTHHIWSLEEMLMKRFPKGTAS